MCVFYSFLFLTADRMEGTQKYFEIYSILLPECMLSALFMQSVNTAVVFQFHLCMSASVS